MMEFMFISGFYVEISLTLKKLLRGKNGRIRRDD